MRNWDLPQDKVRVIPLSHVCIDVQFHASCRRKEPQHLKLKITERPSVHVWFGLRSVQSGLFNIVMVPSAILTTKETVLCEHVLGHIKSGVLCRVILIQ